MATGELYMSSYTNREGVLQSVLNINLWNLTFPVADGEEQRNRKRVRPMSSQMDDNAALSSVPSVSDNPNATGASDNSLG